MLFDGQGIYKSSGPFSLISSPRGKKEKNKKNNNTRSKMTDLRTKPRPGQPIDTNLYARLLDEFLDTSLAAFQTPENFSAALGVELANHQRAIVTLMRVPFAPYYDTKFIFKWFRTENYVQPHIEQVDLEAASLRHAAEAFQRNNNFARAPRVYTTRRERNLIAMECLPGRGYRDGLPEWWPKERMVRFVRQLAVVRLAIMTQVQNQLGVPRHAPDGGGRIGPYCSFVWWDDHRVSLPPSPLFLRLIVYNATTYIAR